MIEDVGEHINGQPAQLDLTQSDTSGFKLACGWVRVGILSDSRVFG